MSQSNITTLALPNGAIIRSELAPAPETLEALLKWLGRIGLPPLPVCPKEPVEEGKSPKQPRFMNRMGKVIAVKWKQYQKEMPTQDDINKWFHNFKGIATIPKYDGEFWITFIDFDQKNFESQEDCDQQLRDWEDQNPIMQHCPKYRSQSGGYRYIVALKLEPENFSCVNGFKLSVDGSKAVGEVLCKGGATSVLPLTEGLNGSYSWIRWCENPPVIEKLEDISIYPIGNKAQVKPETTTTYVPSQSSRTNDLTPVIEEICSKLEFEAAFNWEGHDFKYEGTNKVRGKCPWHESESGTSFYAERKRNALLWRCSSCDIGGHLIGYRSYQKGGQLKPKGKEFINIVKELSQEAGVTFPERSKPQKAKQPPKQSIDRPAIDVGETTNTAEVKDVNEVTDYAKVATDEAKDKWEMTTTSDRTIYEALFEDGKGDWAVIDDAFYQYSTDICSGIAYWKHVDDSEIHHLIAHALMDVYKVKETPEGEKTKQYIYANNRNKESAFKYAKSALSKKQTAYNNYYIAFFNCTVDLRTGEQLPHKREHYCIHAVGANYTPNMPLPEVFKNFLCNAFGEDLIELIRAVTRMLLDPTIPYGYFPHVIGSSGSGKGTLIRLWGSLIGEGGRRSINSFRELATPEGRHQHLSGVKLVNLPDVGGFQNSLQAFYELVDNGTMSGRALFASYGYDRQWNCRFAMASVNYLSIENSGDGWDRRCIPLPTKRRQGEVDPDLGRKLQQVKGEIISWALAMDRAECVRLITNSVAVTERIAELKREQAIHSDSIRAFVDMCLVPSEDKNATLEKSKLHEYYIAYCKVHGFQASSYNKFVSHLQMVLPKNYVDRKFKRVNGKREITPSHFYYIKANSGVFTTTANFDPPITHCWKEFCREGGLDLFDDFWQNSDTGFTPGTGLAQGQNSHPVPAETLTNQELHQVTQVAHPSGEILYKENGSAGEKMVKQVDGLSEKNGSNSSIYVEDFAANPVSPCANAQETCTARDTDWHRVEKNDPVSPCATLETCVTDEDPRTIAANAIKYLLNTETACWEVVRDILSEMGIAAYTQLQGFLSLAEFKKLELLLPVDQRQLDF